LDVDLATECVLEPHSARNFNYGTTVVFNFAGRNHMKHIDMVEGHSPIIATAIHDGHDMREELRPFLALSEGSRMREEDPYSDYLADISDAKIVVHTSRFEVDLNRPRSKAIYRTPEEAWGLKVWTSPLPQPLVEASLTIYDTFYQALKAYLFNVLKKYGAFVVFDLHTYNHRRVTPYRSAPSLFNPDINIGTGSLPERWRPLTDVLISTLKGQRIKERRPDVRENVNFMGGQFSRWINETFGDVGCAIAIEVKKTFMDEWTGRVDIQHLRQIQKALASAKQQLMPMVNLTTQDYV
jgi:N-formylglutamate amidohydrolase